MTAAIKYLYLRKLLTINELMPFSIVCRSTLAKRLQSGWYTNDALTFPARKSGTSQRSYNLPKTDDLTSSANIIRNTKKALYQGTIKHKVEIIIEKQLLKKELMDIY